jgi:hypothetical protein
VLGFIPRSSAAAPAPEIFQRACSNAAMMFWCSTLVRSSDFTIFEAVAVFVLSCDTLAASESGRSVCKDSGQGKPRPFCRIIVYILQLSNVAHHSYRFKDSASSFAKRTSDRFNRCMRAK